VKLDDFSNHHCIASNMHTFHYYR